MSHLRAAVVGAGHLGRFHAEKYTMIEGVDLAAICDLDPEAGESLAASRLGST